jgi:hypothetical protein
MRSQFKKTSPNCETSPSDYLHYRISILPFVSHFSIDNTSVTVFSG